MVALRSCMQENNWLDHQGNPLGGECEPMNTIETLLVETSRLDNFLAGLPQKCAKKKQKTK
jgi:hypothetical protein